MTRPILSAKAATATRTPDWSGLLTLEIERGGSGPVFQQIYRALRKVILDRVVPSGSRLPPTRHLSHSLGVARSSVVAVYEQLWAEGLVVGQVGAGTFVAQDLPEAPLEPVAVTTPDKLPREEQPQPVARYAALAPNPHQFGPAPFNTGRSTFDARSLTVWKSLTMARLRRFDPELLGYADPRGSKQMREAVAHYLRAARAVHCDPDQIVILSGVQQAIDLILKVLVEPGTPVWVEDPGYPAMCAALTAAKARLVPVPVDAQGLIVREGLSKEPNARMAYVTPSNQFPLGSLLSMARRMELLAWAREAGAWIIEDDYDSEFRYAGRPLASLQGIDASGRVIYLGTLSKALFPGLRLGYAVVPYDLLDAISAARFLTDRHPAGLAESVVADFIDQGHFAAHLRRMRARYKLSRDLLVQALREETGGRLTFNVPDQGMNLVAHLPQGLRDTDLASACFDEGVTVRPVSPMFLKPTDMSAIMLGFTGHEDAALREGARRLGRALKRS